MFLTQHDDYRALETARMALSAGLTTPADSTCQIEACREQGYTAEARRSQLSKWFEFGPQILATGLLLESVDEGRFGGTGWITPPSRNWLRRHRSGALLDGSLDRTIVGVPCYQL